MSTHLSKTILQHLVTVSWPLEPEYRFGTFQRALL